MLEEGLRRFAQENFSHRYYPILHGESGKIQPLALAVKKPRSVWKRPRGKYEIIVLAELAKYVQDDKQAKMFSDFLKRHVKEEMFKSQPPIDIGASTKEDSMGVTGYLEGTIKISDDYGVLKLGKLSQKYIDDRDLRGILANTPLDHNKMKSFGADELFLITSVISSEQFQLEGKRKQETEAEFSGETPPKVSPFFKHFFPPGGFHAGYHSLCSPSEVASRNFPAPILFRCSHVNYLEDGNRLEIPQGEYVGKLVTRDVFGSTYVDETGPPDPLSAEDCEKLDPLLLKVLLPTKNREQRKAVTRKYLYWFEKALTTGQRRFVVPETITPSDRELFRIANISCEEEPTRLDLRALNRKDIHGYAVVFRNLLSLSSEKWEGIEKDGANLSP